MSMIDMHQGFSTTRRQDHIAKIYRLPDEILTYIFDLCRHTLNASHLDQRECTRVNDGCVLGCRLRRVSHRFRDVANKVVPSLWSTVHVAWNQYTEATQVEWIRACVSQIPEDKLLSIRFKSSNGARKDLNEFDYLLWDDEQLSYGRELHGSLSPYMHRLMMLDITTWGYHELDAMFTVFGEACIPKLTSLRVEHTGVASSQSAHDGFSGYMPMLNEIIINNCYLYYFKHTRLSQLTRLAIESPATGDSWTEVVALLKRAPALEHLEIYDVKSSHHEINMSTWDFSREHGFPTHICTCLLSLSVNRGTQALLGLLHAPSLQSLTIANVDMQRFMLHLASLIPTNPLYPQLKTLRIVEHALLYNEPTDYSELFIHMPVVEQVILEKSYWFGERDLGILTALTRIPLAWPRLSRITCTGMTRLLLDELLMERAGMLSILEFQEEYVLRLRAQDQELNVNGIQIIAAPFDWARSHDMRWNAMTFQAKALPENGQIATAIRLTIRYLLDDAWYQDTRQRHNVHV